jgi:hypothetical protein
MVKKGICLSDTNLQLDCWSRCAEYKELPAMERDGDLWRLPAISFLRNSCDRGYPTCSQLRWQDLGHSGWRAAC